jgi:type II secretory pathway pseudopilin PulG
MANNNEEYLDETRTTATFTQEELNACFDSSDEEKSDEEEFDAKAWRQSIRDLHRDLEMKKYAYYRRIVLLEQRERKDNRKRIIREAVERQRREEAERERQAQRDFDRIQRQLRLNQPRKKRRVEKRAKPIPINARQDSEDEEDDDDDDDDDTTVPLPSRELLCDAVFPTELDLSTISLPSPDTPPVPVKAVKNMVDIGRLTTDLTK